MDQKKIALMLGILCMLLSLGISIQIKTVDSTTTGIGKTKTENVRKQIEKNISCNIATAQKNFFFPLGEVYSDF